MPISNSISIIMSEGQQRDEDEDYPRQTTQSEATPKLSPNLFHSSRGISRISVSGQQDNGSVPLRPAHLIRISDADDAVDVQERSNAAATGTHAAPPVERLSLTSPSPKGCPVEGSKKPSTSLIVSAFVLAPRFF